MSKLAGITISSSYQNDKGCPLKKHLYSVERRKRRHWMTYDVQTIANLVGGALILSYFIWQVILKIAKETSWFRTAAEKRKERERLQRKCEFEEFSEELINDFTATVVQELKNEGQLNRKRLDLLVHSTNNLLRREIIRIYHDYSPYKQIRQYNKEFLTRLYTDYNKLGGNSFIEDLWEEMKTWQVVANTAVIGDKVDSNIPEEREI